MAPRSTRLPMPHPGRRWMKGGLGRDRMRLHAEACIGAWNRRDLDTVLAGFSEDAELRSPRGRGVTGSPCLEGKAALAPCWRACLEEFPLRQPWPGVLRRRR